MWSGHLYQLASSDMPIVEIVRQRCRSYPEYLCLVSTRLNCHNINVLVNKAFVLPRGNRIFMNVIHV